MYRDQFGEFVCGYKIMGLKGLMGVSIGWIPP